MYRRRASPFWAVCLFLSCSIRAFCATDGTAWADLSLEQGYRMNGMLARERRMQDDTVTMGDIATVRGLPTRFTIRPMIDNSLCVNRVQMTSTAVVRARFRSGLPQSDQAQLEDYGINRLVLMNCSGARTETFVAEAALGRSYHNSDTNYRIGFLKNPSDLSQCAYGVNSTYTDGHPVFGVTGTLYYEEHANKTNASSQYDENDNEMDWYDDYNFNYASYVRYGYDPATLVSNSTFKSPNPLPVTMLDASGWGPFPSSWGPCMKNPTIDSATPTDTTASELQLRYQTFIFLDVRDTASISHLPAAVRRNGYALATLGPDRPQPDVSPLAGEVDAGALSADLGGGDKPYGTGYSSLVSNELCMTTSVVKEGAEVRLARCNPVAPTLEQAFQIVGVLRARVASMQLGERCSSLRSSGQYGGRHMSQGGRTFANTGIGSMQELLNELSTM
ncbi:hypothetical protein VOLCADRAFT_106507 [Volvox carteri f. nagariensis]|uniref:Rhodanese domain-containing protein n=1 Tax=Volvox carteri f. nagariensis TaxID=3068 RepID=D8U7Y8_VOLCA|nr:uncharacterized protein VOLCADRAFT_106507 [Volvox carteri f. nagariensis]EFJ44176.1 hypothetical protein VOLCADRAFT_106507 [Volvox carteri f. nagariensis]|eukprot:XP_002954770.1 hypothetical protein VOLCADRAFT_106507 [Volvox carteri f. nagariensis]